MKKLLAFLCVTALLLTSVFTGIVTFAETALTQLAPSSYGADAQVFTVEDWAGGGTWAPTPFVNAKFEAMVVPSDKEHYLCFGHWGGTEFYVQGQTAYILFHNVQAFTEVTLAKSYVNVPYKLTITSELQNDGTEAEQLVYNVWMDDTKIITDCAVTTAAANADFYAATKTKACLRAKGCTIYNVATYEQLYSGVEVELTTLKPSNYAADGQVFAEESWAGAPNEAPTAFVNAKFEAMVKPSADSHSFMFGFWAGLALDVTGTSVRLWYRNVQILKDATLPKNYANVPYKLTFTSEVKNEGKDNEATVYNVWFDDVQVIKDFVLNKAEANADYYATVKDNRCLRVSNCTLYDVSSYALLYSDAQLTQLTPSTYNADGQTFAGDGSYDWAYSSASFADAEFTAMIKPTHSTHYIQIGSGWTGMRLTIEGTSMRFNNNQWGGTTATLDKSYVGSFYKLTIKAVTINKGIFPAEGKAHTTDHEHLAYVVFINDEPKIVNHTLLNTSDNSSIYGQGGSILASGFMMMDVASYDDRFTDSGDDEVADVLYDDYDTITLEDFGIEYGAYYKAKEAATSKITANTVFETDIMFEYGGRFVYPITSDGNGIMLTTEGKTNLKLYNLTFDCGLGEEPDADIVVIYPAELNTTSLVGNKLNLKVVLEKGNFGGPNMYDEDGNEIEVIENDIRLTYYINNVKVWQDKSQAEYEEYDDLDNPVLSTIIEGTGISAFTENGTILNRVYISDVVVSNPADSVPVMMENVVTGALELDVLNTTDVILAEGDTIAMGKAGTLAVTNGVLVYTDKDGVATNIGTGYAGKQFNVKALLEATNIDADGLKDDANISIWVNDKSVYNGKRLADVFLDAQAVTLTGTAQLAAPNQVPTGLREYSSSDFGVADTVTNTITAWGHGIYGTLLPGYNPMNTLFSMKVNTSKNTMASGYSQLSCSYGGVTLNLLGGTETGGAQLHVNGTLVDNAENVMQVGVEHLYQISIQYTDVDLNGDGVKNDVRVGFFVDGKLINGKFYFFDTSADIATYLASTTVFNIQHVPGTSSDTLTAEMTYTVKDAGHSADSYTNYEEIGIGDFGFENGTYNVSSAVNGHAYANSDYTVIDTINNKVLKTKINFVRKNEAGGLGLWLTYSGFSNMGDAIRLSVGADNKGYFTMTRSDGYSQSYILPDLVPNKEVELMISTKMVDGHWKYGIYIDGVLQNNRFYYWCNKGDSELSTAIGLMHFAIDTNPSEIVLGGSDYYEAKESSEYVLTPVEGMVAYTVNGVAITTETALTDVGEYTITSSSTITDANQSGMTFGQSGTKKVIIYKENDLNADNVVNVLDFIAAQKSAAEDSFDLGRIGALAAGVAIGERCTAKEILAVKLALLFGL